MFRRKWEIIRKLKPKEVLDKDLYMLGFGEMLEVERRKKGPPRKK